MLYVATVCGKLHNEVATSLKSHNEVATSTSSETSTATSTSSCNFNCNFNFKLHNEVATVCEYKIVSNYSLIMWAIISKYKRNFSQNGNEFSLIIC